MKRPIRAPRVCSGGAGGFACLARLRASLSQPLMAVILIETESGGNWTRYEESPPPARPCW